MKLSFVGAAHEVTGSCHCIEVEDIRILVDCGMEQGEDIYENQEIPFNAASVDYVFVTHAHIDHTGLLPLLYARGFRGKIFATQATCDLCDIMLRDSAHIQMQEAEWKNRKGKRSGKTAVEPLYEMKDALGVIKHFVGLPYNVDYEVCDAVSVRFVDVGHLLGSASVVLNLTENGITRKIVFSGDIGNEDLPLIKDPTYVREADYVVTESTYGNRNHAEQQTDYVAELARITQETFERGGNLVIPAFAVGRTQEMLFYFRKIKEEKMIKGFEDFAVYMDSPLAIEATTIFTKNMESCFSPEAMAIAKRGQNPIIFPGLKYAITSDESKLINFDDKPKVIISASGMCEAGRIRHHLKHNLWRQECTILFVGYQANGTLGRILQEGVSEVRLFGETIEVKAKIAQLDGFSGHADKEGLIRWIQAFHNKPEKVFVVHGEDSVCDEFVYTLRSTCGLDAWAPYSGGCYDLVRDMMITEGIRERQRPKKHVAKAVSSVFARLLAAGQRLMTVIQHNEGGANKDLAKFADQINALCDKWDR